MDNGKEFTRQILAEMVKMARQIFAKITVQENGTFTAYELWKCKDAMGNILHIDWNGTEHDRYTATVGTFKFEFAAHEVFETVYKFEKLGCVKQSEKARFIKGEQIGEEIQERAMYLKDGKAVVRKKTLNKVSERVAIAPNTKTKKWELYYLAGGVWHYIADNVNKDSILRIWHRIEADDKLIYDLLGKWNFNNNSTINDIYRPLYEALQSEAADSADEELKCEGGPENGVISHVAKTDAKVHAFNQIQTLKNTEKQMRRNQPGYIALIRYGLCYYIVGDSAEQVRQIGGIRECIRSIGDVMMFEIEELDDVLVGLIKAGYKVAVHEKYASELGSTEIPNERICEGGCGGSPAAPETIPDDDEKAYEDLPPVPYNRQGHQKTRTAHNAPTNAAGSEISPFEPRLRVGGIIYRPTSKVAAERTGSPNLGICRVLVRGATKEIATDIKFDYMIIDKFKNNITRWKY